MIITDKMVEAALNAWYGMDQDKWWMGDSTLTRDMSAALIAALAVSGYGEVVEALRAFPLPEQGGTSENNYRRILGWLYSRKPDVAALIIDLDCAALARVTPEPQS